MIKKKGSIVPRYIIRAYEKKSQHLLKFGCDVKIEGNKITVLSEGDVFVIPSYQYCNLKKKKGTQKRRVKGYALCTWVRVQGYRRANSIVSVKIPCQYFKIPEGCGISLNA